MTQRFSLYADLTIRENLEFVARVYGLAKPRAAAGLRSSGSVSAIAPTQLRRRALGRLEAAPGAGRLHPALAPALLLDEPTAGVDPKARRDFWDEIHALAQEGLTVLVTTHYMDEAERCHEIAYIAHGELLAQGTVEEVVENVHLAADTVNGPDLAGLAARLRRRRASRWWRCSARRCTSAAATPRGSRPRSCRCARAARARRRDVPTLEDVFIDLMSRSTDNFGEAATMSFGRFYATFVKELIQLRRDRITFATMIFIPLCS